MTDSGYDATIGAPPVAADYPDMVPVDPSHYVIAEEIARGGMGRIRIARDRRLGRKIAIKEILVSRGDIARRFEREARITARLEHPAIVSIHEAGAWPSGEPFIAMRLVSGRSLDEVIQGAKTLAERMALLPNVLAVADAIAYAHEQRVIHRDLKPKNVLVGKFGETVVIDWGLAKDRSDPDDSIPPPDPDAKPAEPVLTGMEETLGSEPPTVDTGALTVAGSVMGTPAYMPPEQARGETVDERADVYAIGAILYHVLSGKLPVAAKTLAAALELVIAGDITPLAKLEPDVPTELAAIVTKAMARDAKDRYPSAAELANDLRRFQTGQLVGAHRYSAGELFRKWLRKHRAVVSVATISFVAFAIFAVISVRRIIHEREVAEEQRLAADQARRESEALVGFMLGDLKDQLGQLGRLNLLDTISSRAIDYYKQRPPGEPELEAKRAAAMATRAAVLEGTGDLAGALDFTRSALAIRRSLPDSTPFQKDLAASYRKLSDLLRAKGDAPGATQAARDALGVAETIAKRDPADGTLQRELAISHERIAATFAKEKPVEALAEYRVALGIREALAKTAPDNLDWQRDLSIAHERIGRMLEKTDPPGALVELRAGLAIAKTIVEKDAKRDRWRDVAILEMRIGDALAEKSPAEAIEMYRDAKAIDERMIKEEPGNVKWWRDLSIAQSSLGDVLRETDRAAALVEYRASLEIAKRLAAQDPKNVEWQRDVAVSHETIAKVLFDDKDVAGAVAEYTASYAILDKLAKQDPSNPRWKEELADTLGKLDKAKAGLPK